MIVIWRAEVNINMYRAWEFKLISVSEEKMFVTGQVIWAWIMIQLE